MFELILENEAGDQINFAQNNAFTITEIDGLNPPPAIINTSQIALMDGAKYSSSKLDVRTINIAFAIEYSAAQNRIAVYNVLKSKQYVKLTYNGQYRQVWIEGYISSIDISYFEMKQIVTCSILCPSPYFKGAQTIVNELKNIVSAFHFPFSSTSSPQLVMSYYSNDLGIQISNDGDVDCGMIIELYARAAVSDPTIYNYITQDFIGLDFDMEEADLITIDTTQGQKTVTLLRDGTETNIFNAVIENSTWLQLPANGGTFVLDVGTGNTADLMITFNHDDLYEGV